MSHRPALVGRVEMKDSSEAEAFCHGSFNLGLPVDEQYLCHPAAQKVPDVPGEIRCLTDFRSIF